MKFRLHPQAAALAVLGLAAGVALAQGRSTLQLLPTLGGPGSVATGLNDQGQVVGYSLDAQGVERGFVWSTAGGVQAITGVRGRALAINGGGQVVGWEWRDGAPRPFAWDAAGGLRHLDTPFGIGEAATINDQGVIGGWHRESGDFATVWHPDGRREWVQHGRRVGGLNQQGAVLTYTGGDEVVLWQPDRSSQLLRPLYGADRLMTAAGLNNRNQVVGSTQRAGGSNAPLTAYLWDAQRGMRDLGHLGGGSSGALAIGDAGQVVGMASVAGGDTHATLWNPQLGLHDLNRFAGAGNTLVTAAAINGHAQVAGRAFNAGGERAYLLTLHPDWSGGDGHWDDNTGQRWNWAATGTAAARVGAMHDVVIDPGRSATVLGSTDGSARTLRIGGTAGHSVTLDLNGGSLQLGDGQPGIHNPSVVAAGGVLRGGGRLVVREDLQVQPGGRVQVDAGQAMRIDVDFFDNRGLVRAQGLATSQARLEIGGGSLYNNGQIQAVHAEVVFDTALVNFGQISLQGSQLTMARPGIDGQLANFQGGIVALSFGDSVVNGRLSNRGLLVVSNGARASFHGEVDNTGELRVSAGGAANFFGAVSAGGSITGGGEIRFESALSPGGGNPTALQVDPEVQLGGSVQMEPGDHISFGRAVLVDGAALVLDWAAAGEASAGTVFDLFDWNGGLGGSFSTLSLPTLGHGLVWDTSDLYLGGSLSIAPVPEPRAWALLLAGLGLVVMRRHASPTTAT